MVKDYGIEKETEAVVALLSHASCATRALLILATAASA